MTDQTDSGNLERWVRLLATNLIMYLGSQKLAKWVNTELTPTQFFAAELNQSGSNIIADLGNEEFKGFVGFIDMRGFSLAASGKRPKEIKQLAGPFIDAVISVAQDHHCFIDKTIGDEVMIVHPLIGSSSARLRQ